jgi:hypothetical protein
MNKIISFIILLLSSILILSSCKISKHAIRKKTAVDSSAIVHQKFVLDSMANQALLDQYKEIWNPRIDFETFTCKAKMRYDGKNEKQTFSASIRIVKDQQIWVHISALDIFNVARVLITPDTLKILLYTKNEAYILPYSELNNYIPVSLNFKDLQDLLIGNPLENNQTTYNASENESTLTLQNLLSTFSQSIAYNKQDSLIKTIGLQSIDENGPSCIVQFFNYNKENFNRFANVKTFNIINKGDNYFIDMQIQKFAFNEKIEMPFTIPKSFILKSNP